MNMRRTLITIVALAASSALVTPGQASGATVEDYSITIKHAKKTDTVVGSAKDVGGNWSLVLEWRETKKKQWEALAGTGPVKGMKKQKASNGVRGDDFDFTGQWRSCVLKASERTCTKPITVE